MKDDDDASTKHLQLDNIEQHDTSTGNDESKMIQESKQSSSAKAAVGNIQEGLEQLAIVTKTNDGGANNRTETGTGTGTGTVSMLDSLIQKMEVLDFGTYRREQVSNVTVPNGLGRQLFDFALRLMLSYQHELAAQYFKACLELCPHTALAHGLLALCHGPNYNFKGTSYYEVFHNGDVLLEDMLCIFPSQYVADRHSAAAMATIEEQKRQRRANHHHNSNNNNNSHKKKHAHNSKGKRKGSNKSYGATTSNQHVDKAQPSDDIDKGEATSNELIGTTDIVNNNTTPEMISDIEVQLLAAIRILTGTPGVDSELSDETVGRPYADAMRKVYQNYPDDPEVVYFFAESLMVLNAWQLYEYPSGKVLSPDVCEVRELLERALQVHTNHPGLIHMYVHLSEMSPQPELALSICEPLRHSLPHAGHLLHMPSHIDVLLGDYEKCIQSNLDAIAADLLLVQCSPATAGRESFYFGYIAHDYHMAIYGAILGGMEQKGMEIAENLNSIVNENLFNECPSLVSYLESYAATDIHIMTRFGRWKELLEVEMPSNKNLMLYRTASILCGRTLALTMLGNYVDAKKEADRFDTLRKSHPEVSDRILHNNSVADLLAVDAILMRGEIAYREGKHTEGLALLRKAVNMQDNLNFDEPWGKMQPIRHALGGLLLEQGHLTEAEDVFRKDLSLHPRNPWALVGLITCLDRKYTQSCCCTSNDTVLQQHEQDNDIASEIVLLKEQYHKQRTMKWADFNVVVACECCVHPDK